METVKTQSFERQDTRWYVNLFHGSALLRSTLLLIIWLAVWQVGRLVEYTEHASVWFPPAGFTFSCLLILGWRAVIPIMMGAIIITLWSANHYQLSLTVNEQIWAGFLFGLAHIIPYWIASTIVGHLAKKDSHSVPQLIVTFLLVAGLSALVTAFLVISSLVYTNQLDISEFNQTLLPFWVGDMAGVIALGPLFSIFLIRVFPDANVRLDEFTYAVAETGKSRSFKIILNVFLIVLTMLLAYLFKVPESAFAIFFLTVTHMWIACTESPFFNVISLAFSSFLIVLLVHLFGLMDHVMVYQFAINVIAANALFGIAIPQLKAVNQKLKLEVFTDALTKVSSRQYMEQRAQLEIMQSHAEGIKLSLVVFDLDRFKQVNDTYGHNAGDKALKRVSHAAKKLLQNNDVIARFGGDEFVLLLPGLSQSEAFDVVEKIRRAIHEIQVGDEFLSSSFGIAQLSPRENYKTLFQRADEALYISKENGGNQISQAPDKYNHSGK
ncbi:diguanylate cyclase domain-containing protein [Marinicella sp. W31]|uniref:sensor domain-containing diguanylate cyclase n=1 Tax=Marinicella sp. W31 TaxID=3023713 RepID=UPI0037566FC7